jgi:NAD-dependent SIR2 family protein deacetylase
MPKKVEKKVEKLTLSKLTQAGFSPYAAFGWCASCRRWIPKSEIIYKQTEKRLVTICPHCGNFGVRLRPHQKIAKNKGWNSEDLDNIMKVIKQFSH